jgi:phosphate transport system substrate-binding protein
MEEEMKRTLMLSALGFASLLVGGCGGCNTRLNGSGSSFVKPMMDKWAKTYKQEKKVEINYQSKGSSAGIADMIDKSVDFGATDAPLNDEQLAKARDKVGAVVHIPLVMGGVVPAYNLKDLNKPILFTGKILADIYLGKITKWDDDALKAVNAGLDLPSTEIKVVHRSDGSGTTYIFTDYLNKVSPDWKKQVGPPNTAVKWPTGTGQKGTEGVAGEVKRTPGAIGYVELIYALENKIPYGEVQNKEGKYILASLESVTEAAKGAVSDIPEDLRYSLTDKPGKDTYPICGTTWAVVFEDQTGNKNGKALVEFLRWLTHDGQEMAKELRYSRLPKELVERIDKKLDAIKVK